MEYLRREEYQAGKQRDERQSDLKELNSTCGQFMCTGGTTLFLASLTRPRSLCFWCSSPKIASIACSQRSIKLSRLRLKAWAMRRYSLLNLLPNTPTSSVYIKKSADELDEALGHSRIEL